MNLSARYLLPEMPAGLEGLVELALDLRWSWSHRADSLWRRLDSELWQRTHNPWMILIRVGDAQLQDLAGDREFVSEVAQQLAAYREAMASPTWFSQHPQAGQVRRIAYFSMEFGICEALPIYSGGLGILAGDTLKTASDLGVPLVGVGLLYQQGYFRQVLDPEGHQLALYPYNDPIQLPVTPVRLDSGEWLTVEIPLPGRTLYLQVWQAKVGSVQLLLLDSNHPLNRPADRALTSELYGGGKRIRLQQEMVLGIAGWRALQALELPIDVCHLNEGHAAFAVLERARTLMDAEHTDFFTALTTTRAGNLFTTHTPVEAGFDQFPATLIRRQMAAYASELGIDMDTLLGLARVDSRASDADFNMALLALRGSLACNGVSALHGRVSRQLFAPSFPRWPEDEIPIGHVTNGVHIPSWDSPPADLFWTRIGGRERWRGKLENLSAQVMQAPPTALWELRNQSRKQLVEYVRQRLGIQRAFQGQADQTISAAAEALDPDALTLCFARRFATYKRPNLLLHDPDRLAALLRNPQHPVQLVIAGKAHPSDQPGQAMIREWIEFMQRYRLGERIVFLSDYDILMAEQLVQGADVWINTPRRPWEASGTSGMKVLVNGGLNLSERDGWWAEAWRQELGWAMGDGLDHGNDPATHQALDRSEAEQLYRLLENEVIPAFYQRDRRGVPEQWLSLMRHSMAELTPQFSTNRMLREYVEQHYLPLAQTYGERRGSGARSGREIKAWCERMARHWPALHWDDVQVWRQDDGYRVRVQVYIDDLEADDVAVECYADALPGQSHERHPLQRKEALSGAVNGYAYEGLLPAARPIEHYTPRLIPQHPQVRLPLELKLITWLEPLSIHSETQP